MLEAQAKKFDPRDFNGVWIGRRNGGTAVDTKLKPPMTEWAQAGKAYDLFLEGYATNELATEVRMRKAETILQQGDPAQAGSLFAAVAAVEGFAAADHALMRRDRSR